MDLYNHSFHSLILPDTLWDSYRYLFQNWLWTWENHFR